MVLGFQSHVKMFDGHQLSRGCNISPPKLENDERFGERLGPLDNTTGQLDSLIPYIFAQTWKYFLTYLGKQS
jgi:hypothetical protein